MSSRKIRRSTRKATQNTRDRFGPKLDWPPDGKVRLSKYNLDLHVVRVGKNGAEERTYFGLMYYKLDSAGCISYLEMEPYSTEDISEFFGPEVFCFRVKGPHEFYFADVEQGAADGEIYTPASEFDDDWRLARDIGNLNHMLLRVDAMFERVMRSEPALIYVEEEGSLLEKRTRLRFEDQCPPPTQMALRPRPRSKRESLYLRKRFLLPRLSGASPTAPRKI